MNAKPAGPETCRRRQNPSSNFVPVTSIGKKYGQKGKAKSPEDINNTGIFDFLTEQISQCNHHKYTAPRNQQLFDHWGHLSRGSVGGVLFQKKIFDGGITRQSHNFDNCISGDGDIAKTNNSDQPWDAD